MHRLYAGRSAWVHNANTLGGCFLARTYSYTKDESYLALAQKAMQYTAQHQRADGSWYYAEKANSHWVDNFHTGYVLDCFKHYAESTGDHRFDTESEERIRILEEDVLLARWYAKILRHEDSPARYPVFLTGNRHFGVLFRSVIPKPCRWR